MSEYQYYEFQALDRPLTQREMRELRKYSTRATITDTRFVNHYEWGNFKGDASKWMRKYFNALGSARRIDRRLILSASRMPRYWAATKTQGLSWTSEFHVLLPLAANHSPGIAAAPVRGVFMVTPSWLFYGQSGSSHCSRGVEPTSKRSNSIPAA